MRLPEGPTFCSLGSFTHPKIDWPVFLLLSQFQKLTGDLKLCQEILGGLAA
jgi:hypothetical protein